MTVTAVPGVARRPLLVAVILAVALGLRIGEVQSTSYKPVFDAGSYLSLASQVVHHGSYPTAREKGRGAGATVGPTAYFPPGLPFFLAGVDVLTGHDSRRGAVVEPARIAAVVLGTVTVGLIGLVALECFGAATALVAMALAAIYPVLIELSGLVLAENLLTPLLLAAIWSVLRARRASGTARRLGWVAGAGVLTGLASLTHVNGVLLILPAFFAVWGRPWRSWRAAVSPALILAATVLTILPWTIRNAVAMHSFIPISDETGITLVGTYNDASAQNRIVPYKWRFFAAIPSDRQLWRDGHQLPETQVGAALQTQALDYIGNHPGAVLEVGWDNLKRLFELEGSYAWHASAQAIALPESIARVGIDSFWVLTVLALIGAFVPARRRAPGWVWAVPVLLALSVVLVNAETPRFREPLEPFLIMLAACSVVSAGRWLDERSSGRPKLPKGPLIHLDPLPPVR